MPRRVTNSRSSGALGLRAALIQGTPQLVLEADVEGGAGLGWADREELVQELPVQEMPSLSHVDVGVSGTGEGGTHNLVGEDLLDGEPVAHDAGAHILMGMERGEDGKPAVACLMVVVVGSRGRCPRGWGCRRDG